MSDSQQRVPDIYEMIGPNNERGTPRDLYEENDIIKFSSRPNKGETKQEWIARHPWVVGVRVVKVMDRSYAPIKCMGIALTPMCILKTGQEVSWHKLRTHPDLSRFMSAVDCVAKIRQHCVERGIAMEKRF